MTDVTPSTGSLSDPSLASAEKGQRFLDYAVEKCVEFMTWFRGVDPKLG
jgi:creatinine amidohydrolase/Fe(II)-dependent formamide hydrolase-like protein